MSNSYLLDVVRTPRGRGKAGRGALSDLHPQALLAQSFQAVLDRTGVDPEAVEDVRVGCVSQVNEQGANIARNAVLAAGLPTSLTGATVNRFCGSGLEALNQAAQAVLSGQADVMLAGGVESMSRVPMGSDGAGQDGGHLALRDRVFQVPQGISADLIATTQGISREAIDAFALESQRRAASAREKGAFKRELFAVRAPDGAVRLAEDETLRPDTTLEGLTALAPSFAALGGNLVEGADVTYDQAALRAFPELSRIDHVHTAGSSSGLADGAAAALVVSERFLRAHGLTARARVRAMATAGSDPVLMLTGPAPASRKALARAGLDVGDVDLWEINEAFGVVPLQTTRALGVDLDRVNVHGGAIALGHPLGATGVMLVATLVSALEQRDLEAGLATLCIGGGQGIATVLERV